MRKLNLIVVFSKKLDKVLFCIRAKEPYKGMYNFVGGKVENGESNDDAAYRELFEETGIRSDDIKLDHFMDLNYFKYENNLQVYYGILKHDVTLVEEKTTAKEEFEIIPVYGEPLMLSETFGALSSNSLYWTSGDIDFYLSSDKLSGTELLTIAESISTGSLTVAGEK